MIDGSVVWDSPKRSIMNSATDFFALGLELLFCEYTLQCLDVERLVGHVLLQSRFSS